MIYLVTGLPGAGKTLRALTLGIEWVMEGRPVYELGINGINHAATGIQPFPHGGLESWQQLEPRAVLIVDEVQQYLKPRPQGAVIPDWVEALTRNRHGGIDLVFITQDPMLIDNYVRRLVNYHHHVVRPEGDPQMARLWVWKGCQDDARKKAKKGAAGEFTLWRYPQQNYALYKSAEDHTVKWKTPQSLRFAAMGLVLVMLLFAAAWWAVSGIGASAESEVRPAAATPPVVSAAATVGVASPSTVKAPAPAVGPFGFSSQDANTLTTRDYVLHLIPRVDGMPVSAPLYDGLNPSEVPEIYCMSSADSCTCLSEQGTRIRVSDATCRVIARDGSYNPFRKSQVRG